MKTLLLCLALLFPGASALRAGAFDQLPGGGYAPPPPPPSAPAYAGPQADDYAMPVEPMPEEEYYRVRPLTNFAGASKSAVDGPQDKASIPYLLLATAEAKAQGVDLSLILAIIKKESAFKPKAESSVGAKGLMQLMPATAKWIGMKDLTKICDPATNIKFGTKLMKYLWGRFGEADLAALDAVAMELKSSRMAVAAYNAGAGNVKKYNDVPPFKETQYYVTKVTAYFSDFETMLAE